MEIRTLLLSGMVRYAQLRQQGVGPHQPRPNAVAGARDELDCVEPLARRPCRRLRSEPLRCDRAQGIDDGWLPRLSITVRHQGTGQTADETAATTTWT